MTAFEKAKDSLPVALSRHFRGQDCILILPACPLTWLGSGCRVFQRARRWELTITGFPHANPSLPTSPSAKPHQRALPGNVLLETVDHVSTETCVCVCACLSVHLTFSALKGSKTNCRTMMQQSTSFIK